MENTVRNADNGKQYVLVAQRSLTFYNQHKTVNLSTKGNIMPISIYDSSLLSHRTSVSQSQQSVAACREIPAQLSQVQVHRSTAAALQYDMEIAAYCAIRPPIYGHISVLNLHSMCAALGKTQLLFWFLNYCFHFPTYLCHSLFLPLVPFFVFCLFTKLVALFPHICYFCLSLYHHQFHFHTNNTAPFHSIVLVMLQFVSLLIFAVHLLKPSLAVLRYGLLLISSGSFYIFQIRLSCHFYRVASRICVSNCKWRSIRHSHRFYDFCFYRHTAVNWCQCL